MTVTVKPKATAIAKPIQKPVATAPAKAIATPAKALAVKKPIPAPEPEEEVGEGMPWEGQEAEAGGVDAEDEEAPIAKPVMKKNAGTTTVASKASITKEHKNGLQESSEEVVGMKTVPSGQPMATVGVTMGVTRNLGNYESVRVTVSLTIPCIPTPEEIEGAYVDAQSWVDAKIDKLNNEISENIGG